MHLLQMTKTSPPADLITSKVTFLVELQANFADFDACAVGQSWHTDCSVEGVLSFSSLQGAFS